MRKKTISTILSILFVAFITAPTIIIAVDNTVDVSIFYSITEEENENIKLPFPDNSFKGLESLVSLDSEENSGYYFKNYPKPHLNLISPPPEAHIL
ncbi:hypothetical protein [Hanstruepera neustonica]|uniref:hypothetical protein n=1 Tax=Hanstruepera neustonica TaxID=1445657 RepID=UPI001FAE9937|nr:hypothetical protein [Hanstruepera neustonica]